MEFHKALAPIQTFSTAPGAADFSRRLASRVVDFSRVQAAYPCEIFTQPRRQTFPTAPGVVDFSRNWRPARVRFSPSRGTNPDIFLPLLESLAFPGERWPPCVFFTKPWRQAGHFLHIALDSGLFRGPPRVVFPQTACGILAPEKLTLTTSGGNDALSLALWKSPQRCVSVMRWVCAVLRAAQSAYARCQLAHRLCLCIDWRCTFPGRPVVPSRHFCMGRRVQRQPPTRWSPGRERLQ